MTATYFAERREAVHVLHRGGSSPEVKLDRYRGIGRTEYTTAGSCHDYDPATARSDLRLLPSEARQRLDDLLAPWPVAPAAETTLTDLAADLVREAGGADWSRFVVSLRAYDQDILAGPVAEMRSDIRRFYTVNLEVGTGRRSDGRPEVQARRDSAVSDVAELPGLAAELLGLLRTDLADTSDLPERSLPPAERPVVLAAGPGAMFFHELCGHPLEADVVASGTSHLGTMRGERVAPEWLTVLDDPCSPEASFGYRVDDEGTPAEPVALIRAGVVGDLLHSRASAAAFSERPNGHGRRMSYLYPALPRQAHTRVLPGPHTAAEVLGESGEAVLVHRFRVRYVYVDGGAFGFFAPSALLLDAGKPVARLRDVELTGDTVSALNGVRAVDTKGVAWVGGGGCGKLNQGPLITGFEQPAVRIEGMRTGSVDFAGNGGHA